MSTDATRPPIPEPTLRRLPWYLAYISMLRHQGVEYVSTTGLSKGVNVDAAQIAKDLSVVGLKGKTRIGYEVARLEAALGEFLGFKTMHRAVMLGVGSLGSALMADSGLHRYGLDIVAGFDIDERIVGKTIGGVPIYHISEMGARVTRLKARIGILAVPPESAQSCADQLTACGVDALWNFTPMRITTTAGKVIQNTSIYAHLAVMYNRLDASPEMPQEP